jgi:RHS repeat-associated protein
MAERNDNTGQFTRFHVWSPGGLLLYLINLPGNTVNFPHFDRVGSTLALTSVGGAVTDGYAYDPYGRLLSRSGVSTQPFQFNGAFGVRADGPFRHMRARWYDPRTANFLSPDPIWPVLKNPRELNPYQFARENPLSFVDPEGTFVFLGSPSRWQTSPQGSPTEEPGADQRRLAKPAEGEFIVDVNGYFQQSEDASPQTLGPVKARPSEGELIVDVNGYFQQSEDASPQTQGPVGQTTAWKLIFSPHAGAVSGYSSDATAKPQLNAPGVGLAGPYFAEIPPVPPATPDYRRVEPSDTEMPMVIRPRVHIGGLLRGRGVVDPGPDFHRHSRNLQQLGIASRMYSSP